MKNNEYGWVIILIIGMILLIPAARFLYFSGSNSEPAYVTGPIRTNVLIDSGDPPISDPAEFSSDLEAHVLADGVVTEEEYQQAVDAYFSCVTMAGYAIETAPAPFLPGLFQYEIRPGPGFSTPVPDSVYMDLPGVISDCVTGTTAQIELLYSSQIANPDNADIWELTLTCLVSNHVITDKSTTIEHLRYAITAEDGELQLDFEDERTMSCLENPAQNGINGNPLLLPSPAGTPSD